MKILLAMGVVLIGTGMAVAQSRETAQSPPNRPIASKGRQPRFDVAHWFSLQDTRAAGTPAAPGYDLHVPRSQPGIDDITVFDKRRDTEPELFGSADLDRSLRHTFDAGGDLIKRPADCHSGYTTVAGQPATGADLGGPIGVGSCYW